MQMLEGIGWLTLSGRLTPPTICVLLPDALFLVNSACCLESSALRSKNELVLTPFALGFDEWDIGDSLSHYFYVTELIYITPHRLALKIISA